MKYIKIDKDNNVVARLNSDIPQHKEGYIQVKEFPDNNFNSKFINGKIIKGKVIKTPFMTRTIPFINPNVNKIKNLEDRITKIEELLSKKKLDQG